MKHTSTMTIAQLDQLTTIMAYFRCSRYVLVSTKIDTPENHNGYTFLKHHDVVGVVLFGSGYPLSGLDIIHNGHIAMFRIVLAMSNLYNGQVFPNAADGADMSNPANYIYKPL